MYPCYPCIPWTGRVLQISLPTLFHTLLVRVFYQSDSICYTGWCLFIYNLMLCNTQNTPVRRDMMEIRRLLSVCVLCFFLPSLSARHYLRFNADFSYARDFAGAGASAPSSEGMTLADAQAMIGSGKSEALRNSNGFAPGIGIGYRFSYKAFLLDLGIGAEYRNTVNELYPVSNVIAADIDDTGEPYTGRHTWSSRRVSLQHAGIHIPLMLGAEIKRFYFLAGLKANIDVWGTSKERGAYSMSAKYDRFMDEWTNVSGHGIVADEPYEASAVAGGTGWNIRACAELGYCFYVSRRHTNSRMSQPRYYAGAFAEYSFAGTSGNYQPLMAGVRLTVLLPFPEPRVCRCLND